MSPRLVSLAILKANWNQGRSYLDNFIPFVAECLRTAAGPITVAEVQTNVRETFGISIPQHTLQTLLQRAARQGLVRRANGLYFPNTEKLAERVLAPDQSELVRCYDTLVKQMMTFATERYGRALSSEHAIVALDGYVSAFGTSTVLKGAVADVEFDLHAGPGRENEFVVHAFVQHLSSSDPASFGYFQMIVEGSMLASVVYLPEPGSVERKFKNSTVYLDTPFLLRLLGFQGEELSAPATELVELLRDLGAVLACFDRTLSELRGVLQGAQLYGTGRQTAVGLHFRAQGLKRSDVDLLIAGLPESFRSRRIAVVPFPGYSERTSVDETSFREILEKTVRYSSDSTMQHDLDAIVAVHRLRGGGIQPILEESKAIFLTTNTNLVKASRRFFSAQYDGHSWPHAITDTVLATLVWLKRPLQAPDLPRKQIMADCYAALRPPPNLWNQWLNEIEQESKKGTFTDAQLDIMRFSPEAQRALMDKTFGDPSALSANTLNEVLAVAEAQITAPVAEELRVERTLRAEAEAAADRLKIARDAAVAVVKERVQRHHERLRVKAERRARHFGRGVFALLLVVIVAGILAPMFGWGVLPGPHPAVVLRILGICVSAFAALATVAGAGWGWNISAFAGRIEGWIAPILHRRYVRKFGEES
jgi:hypothetical protein